MLMDLLDMYSGPLLRHHFHSVPRQSSSIPDQCWSGWRGTDCLDRRCHRGWEAALLPELSNHWDLQRGRVSLSTRDGAEE